MPPPLRKSGLEVHLGYWLRRVSNHISGAFAQALQARQMSVAEWVALRLIQESEKLTPGQLAVAMGMTRGAISKVLDKLEAKAWIARATNPEDSRVHWLSLTRSGTRQIPELSRIADRNDEHFFNCLDAKEQATLRRLLQKLTEFHRFQDTPVD